MNAAGEDEVRLVLHALKFLECLRARRAKWEVGGVIGGSSQNVRGGVSFALAVSGAGC